ncbi:MAG TPA: hypothetical protein VFT91_06660 [Dehalococcoidia bacterium]|nr:hypothetical protein [Dehalococcoidia bacterium]
MPQSKGRRQRTVRARRLRVAAALTGVAIVAAALAGGFLLRGPLGGSGQPQVRSAAIVDQLSLTFPNPDFVQQARGLLTKAGYAVDYFPGEQVSVEFYRSLPKRGYDLIVLRAHAGRIRTEGSEELSDDVTLFTAEPLTEEDLSLGRYYKELKDQRLVAARYFGESTEVFYGVTAGFVRSSMKGSFDGALVILMGCDGLRSQRAGQAFLDRGAGAFVSWSEAVSAGHTDEATLKLLEKLLVEGTPVGEAVARTAAEVGPDPAYGAELRVLERGG